MINYLWGIFFIVGIIYSFISHTNIGNVMLGASKDAINLIMNMIPVMCLWLGIMKIAEVSGLLDKLSNLLKPFLKIIFPELKTEDEALKYISVNIVMNMLGLGNAATPFGLKAMKKLQEINKNKDVASRSMITFLVINTSSVTIIPTTTITLRMLHNSINPLEIVPYIIITSTLSSLLGLIIDRLFYVVRHASYS